MQGSSFFKMGIPRKISLRLRPEVAQHVTRIEGRRPQRPPGSPQDDPRGSQEDPKTARERAETAQEAHRGAQNDSERAPRGGYGGEREGLGVLSLRDCPETPPRSGQRPPEKPQEAPNHTSKGAPRGCSPRNPEQPPKKGSLSATQAQWRVWPRATT